VQPPTQQEEDDVIDYIMRCEVCGDSNLFYELIYCYSCGQVYHLECLYPPLDNVTLGEWYYLYQTMMPKDVLNMGKGVPVLN
jgi:hypothetical protein